MITETLVKCVARAKQGQAWLIYWFIYGFTVILNLTIRGLQAAATSQPQKDCEAS